MEEFHVKNFIFSSSATVYGKPQYLPIDEKHPCEGDAITNPYGKSKYVCEHVLKDAAIAHPVCISIFFKSFFIGCNCSRIGILFFYVISILLVLMNQV